MSSYRRVAVIGSGSWGTASAGLIADHCESVVLWSHSPEVAESINNYHKNPRHAQGYTLPHNVYATHSFEKLLPQADALVMAVPSLFLRDICSQLYAAGPCDLPTLVLTKGIEPTTHARMSQIVQQELALTQAIAALTGPNHAEEICQHMISAAVVASNDETIAHKFQELFCSQSFRVYSSTDLIGLELCAAIKNVVAIACGICAGKGLGDNTLAVLMTRGLAEIGRFTTALGGDALTCMGLAGMGDLVATCTSHHSRNRSFGEAFVKGESLAAFEARSGMVVEGARCAQSAWELACELSIEAPLTDAVHAILYEGRNLSDAEDLLLGRNPRDEFYGF